MFTAAQILGIAGPSAGVILAILASFCGLGLLFWATGMLKPRTVPFKMALPFKSSGFSALIESKVVWLIGGSSLLTLALVCVALGVGDIEIPFWEALRTAVWDRDGEYDFVINRLRFPRAVVAVLAGICLAVSGKIFQSLIDNPLVSPDIIGVNQGAAALAVTLLVTGGPTVLLPFAAFAGAVLAAVVVYLLAWRHGISSSRLVLVGIGIGALLASVTTFLTVRFPIEQVAAAARWQAGTLINSSWQDARTLALGMAVLMPLAFIFMRRLRILTLGDDVAVSLGIRVELSRLLILSVGAGLAALAVAVVGPLGFVALLVPQMARLLWNKTTAGTLALTALLGAAMLLGSDIIAQRLFAPVILPAGIITASVGGPLFLFLLYRYNRAL